MDKIFLIAALFSMGGVVVSLFRGMFAMGGTSKKEHKTSNKMMQMRVLFQGLAILFLFLAYFAKA